MVDATVHVSPLQWLHDHVDHEGDDCLLWPFTKNARGYGTVTYARGYTAAAAMCELAHGNRPEGKQSAHSCGVRLCVNPRHLRWATRSENARDKEKHGPLTAERREKSGIESFTIAVHFPAKCRYPFKSAVLKAELTTRLWLAVAIDNGLVDLDLEPIFLKSVFEELNQRDREALLRKRQKNARFLVTAE